MGRLGLGLRRNSKGKSSQPPQRQYHTTLGFSYYDICGLSVSVSSLISYTYNRRELGKSTWFRIISNTYTYH